MDAGERPYVDFEDAYDALLAYLPYGLHAAGLSIQAALEITLGLAVIAGVWAFAVTTERWIPDPRYRLALSWALTACECFVDPGPSLNYNFGRYALPFALLILVTRAMLRGGAWTAFAATAAANTLVYCLSPEMGCALTAAILAWLAIAVRLLACGRIAAGLVGLAVSVGGLVAFASPMFTTLWAYGQSQVLMPVVPNPIMTLFVVSILWVGAWAFATTWALWRGQSPVDVAPDAAQFAACVALAFALLPAAVGRSWPTITIAYGFAPIVLLVGRLLAAGAARAAAVAATLFCFFVAYSAWPGIHADVGRLASELRGSASVGGRRNGEGVPPPMLLTRFRGAYDPLRLVAASAPPITNLGYYSGLRGGDVTTQAALARKMAELQRAPFYLAPTRPERIAEADGPPISRTLNRFARAGLYPFALSAQPGVRRFGADFVDLLLNRCQVLASADGMEVCTLRKDPSAAALTLTRPSAYIAASFFRRRRWAPIRGRPRTMANNPGAKKAIRKIARRTEVNKARRSRVRTFVRKFEEALAAGDLGLAKTAFVEVQSELMRAVGKGVVHKNTGSRKVSRLAAQLKKLQAA